MKIKNFPHPQKSFVLILALVFSLAGCSKKVEAPPPVAAPAAETPAPAPKAATPAASSAIMPSADINKSFADADAAMKMKAYDQAAKALLAAQMQKNITDQQAAEARSRMVGLQRGLAQAIANGDASAKAAADLIRQAHTVH